MKTHKLLTFAVAALMATSGINAWFLLSPLARLDHRRGREPNRPVQ